MHGNNLKMANSQLEVNKITIFMKKMITKRITNLTDGCDILMFYDDMRYSPQWNHKKNFKFFPKKLKCFKFFSIWPSKIRDWLRIPILQIPGYGSNQSEPKTLLKKNKCQNPDLEAAPARGPFPPPPTPSSPAAGAGETPRNSATQPPDTPTPTVGKHSRRHRRRIRIVPSRQPVDRPADRHRC